MSGDSVLRYLAAISKDRPEAFMVDIVTVTGFGSIRGALEPYKIDRRAGSVETGMIVVKMTNGQIISVNPQYVVSVKVIEDVEKCACGGTRPPCMSGCSDVGPWNCDIGCPMLKER